MSNMTYDTELFFSQQSQDMPATLDAYQHILFEINAFLQDSNYVRLFNLIKYIEQGKGFLTYQYIGKSHRILSILNTLLLEHHFQEPLFSNNCKNMDELWQKYMITLFCFRRILLSLSDFSVSEAVTYLRQNPLSPVATYCFLKYELPNFTILLSSKLAEIWSDQWTTADKEILHTLLYNLK